LVLKEITCRIAGGELVGIIGPNGSGKTTLIRALTKVLPLSAGQVLLDGKSLDRYSLRELARRIAVVGRLGEVDLRMSVEDLVLLGRIPHREGIALIEKTADMDIARNAMEATGILHLSDRVVESLSSGERQLAFIARALAQEPQLLLLDEPPSHLDIAHQVRLLDLIKRRNVEKRLTVLVVLHDLNLASQYCDRLLLLDGGSLKKDGAPKEVLTYTTIEEVYNTVVVVLDNPVSDRPYVFLVSEQNRKRQSR
jgi:iron complex transport system ATP-binding protein